MELLGNQPGLKYNKLDINKLFLSCIKKDNIKEYNTEQDNLKILNEDDIRFNFDKLDNYEDRVNFLKNNKQVIKSLPLDKKKKFILYANNILKL